MLTTPRSRCGAKPPEERKAGGKYIVSIEKVFLFLMLILKSRFITEFPETIQREKY